eukprot:2868941-Prymnesium_polylepis.1
MPKKGEGAGKEHWSASRLSGSGIKTGSGATPTLASVVRERTRLRQTTQGERELEHDGAMLAVWAQVPRAARECTPLVPAARTSGSSTPRARPL